MLPSGLGTMMEDGLVKRVTAFQQRVYEAVTRIPRGCVSTYGLVARQIGCAAPRAVGQALKANPFAPEVPCHRVISSSFQIGGFQGATAGAAVRRKLELLDREGVRFAAGRLVDRCRIFKF
jgi:methylated-DNA-[protein]-cysteine S-methyltransferase